MIKIMKSSLFKKIFSTLPNIKIHYPSSQEKIHLIQLFNLITLFFILLFMVTSILVQTYNAALLLFSMANLTLFNYYYLAESKNENFASHFLSLIFFIIMIYLIYTGGVNHTGPLWVSAFPLIVFFLLGLKKGFRYIVLFLMLALIILFIPFDLPLKVEYPNDFKLRGLASFLLVTFLSAVYEYNNTKSFHHMQTLREELEYSSSRDYLTSLFNRRGYKKNIQNIKSSKGVILMCDVDHFKKVNDTHGHDAGDFALQKVAQKIKSILREKDIAVRWGGEEFFIFLPFMSLHNGYLIAEKIRTSIENLALFYADKHISITLSIGIEEMTYNISLEEAIFNADKAMYQAKSKGRNIVSIYT